MLRLIRGWGQSFRAHPSHAPRRPLGSFERRDRRVTFEALEDRWLLATDFTNVADLLGNRLDSLQQSLVTQLNNYTTSPGTSLPVIGDSLGTASQVIERFTTQLQSALATLGTSATPTNAQIQTALATVPLLSDRNGNGVGTDDVLVTRPGGLGAEGFAVQMRLVGSQVAVNESIQFDTGLPSLPIQIDADGELEISVGFAFEFAFTYNSNTQQVAFDSSKNLMGYTPANPNFVISDPMNPLAIFVTAGLSTDFEATATIGFVRGTATPIPGAPNALYATAMVNNLTGTPTVKVDGGAQVNLELAGSFAGTGNMFPGIEVDFNFEWSFSSSNPNIGPPEVSFDNVELDLGTFISNVVGPVFESIQEATDPLEPVLEILNTPIPGLSDLSRLVGQGDITLLDVGGVVAPFTGFGPLYDLAANVVEILDQIQGFVIDDTVKIPLGGFDLDNYDLRTVAAAGDIEDLDLEHLTNFSLSTANLHSLGQTFQEIVNDLPVPDQAKGLLRDLTAGLSNGFTIEFPIFDTPEQVVFNMLLGRDSDLFTLEAEAHVQSEGRFATGLSVFGLGVEYGGEVDIDTEFKFAYDTFGLRNLLNSIANGGSSDVLEDILAGFYIDPTSYFSIAGKMFAGVGASAGIFSADVGGFASTGGDGTIPVSITMVDPNLDGKLRFDEFSLDSFEMSGRFSAALGIEVKVGFEFFGEFIGWSKRFDIANKVLVDFDNDPLNPDGEEGIIASEPDANGNIQLLIGQLAYLRQDADTDNNSERIIIRHVETTAAGQTLEIALRQENELTEYWVVQTIEGVRKVTGLGDVGDLDVLVLPGVNVDVDLRGGQGKASLRYNGTGLAHLEAGNQDSYLLGGIGPNTLVGKNGSDILVMGPGGNSVAGGNGDNTVVINTPFIDTGTIFGGSDPNAMNTLAVMAGVGTVAVAAMPGAGNTIGVNYQMAEMTSPSHTLLFDNFYKVTFNAQDRQTDIAIGDLSAAGVSVEIVNMPTTGSGGRKVSLDTKANFGTTTLLVDPFLHTYTTGNPPEQIEKQEIQIVNSTTGITTYLFGTKGSDTTTVKHHGGSVAIGALSRTGGTLHFDLTGRLPGATDTFTILTPSLAGGNQINTLADGQNNFVIQAQQYPRLVFQGLVDVDSITMNVLGPNGAGTNVIEINASTMHGDLVVNALGDASAHNDITLTHAAIDAAVFIHGAATTSELMLGNGQLARIRHDVVASNVRLSVDNRDAFVGSLLFLDETTFGEWLVPGFPVTPQINFSGLWGEMEIFAGGGDRHQLDVTPEDIASLRMHNENETQDPVYTANWTVPIYLLGNFAFYAGQILLPNGTVQRVKRLTNVGVPVELRYAGPGPSEVVLDGDLDAPGAEYTINGSGGIFVRNETIGLQVTITGFSSDADELYVFMPGATVDANLQRTSRGTIYLDGQARLAGTNTNAPNDITIATRYGQNDMVPVGQYNSKLDMFNDVYVLGAKPQDHLTVNVPTHVRMTAAVSTTFDISSNPDVYATFTGIGSPALMAWIGGDRPGHFIFNNAMPDTPNFWNEFARSPFVEHPYWLDLPYYDAPHTVTYFYRNGDEFDEVPYEGIVRLFLVDPNPVAISNQSDLNASQLRGSFQFNIETPDYTYLKNLAYTGMQAGTQNSVSYNGFHTWSSSYDKMRIAFGQSNIALSHVNPELNVAIDGGQNFAYVPDIWTLVAIKSPYAKTIVDFGAGNVANIEGNVSIQRAEFIYDDHLGTTPNNLVLTASSLAGWSTVTNTTDPVLTLPNFDNRELEINLKPLDRLGIEGTATTATRTVIHTVSNTGAPNEIYLTGRTLTRPLEVEGNITLIAGRRLEVDGDVIQTGSVAGLLASNNNNTFPTYYTFTGAGNGQIVFDDSKRNSGTTGNTGQTIIYSDNVNLGKQRFEFSGTYNMLVYANNTNLDIYEPLMAIANFNGRLDHRGAGRIRYYANPLSPATSGRVDIGAAFGPIEVYGRGAATAVEISNWWLYPTPAGQPSAGTDLYSAVLAPITVTNAQLSIRPDQPNSTRPAQVREVVIGSSTITGIAGAPIHYSNLKDTGQFSTTPGLLVSMPRFQADLRVTGTASGATTGISVRGEAIRNTVITGTTAGGRLALGTFGQSNGFSFIDPSEMTFATQNLTIGQGSTDNIQGDVLLGRQGFFTVSTPIVIDNRSSSTPRTVVADLSNTYFYPAIQGLATGVITMSQLPAPLSIYGSAGSQYSLFRVETLGNNISLYAGAGSTVNVGGYYSPGSHTSQVAPWRILGAGTVNLNRGPAEVVYANASQLYPRIEADPARPTAITNLAFNGTNFYGAYYHDNPFVFVGSPFLSMEANGGIGQFSVSNATTAKRTLATYAAATTQVSVTTAPTIPVIINVESTSSLPTTLNPGAGGVNVLATNGPLQINQSPAYFNPIPITIGNAGSLQSILGNITITADSSTLAPRPVVINNSADGTNRTLTITGTTPTDLLLAGLSPASIRLLGAYITTNVTAGSGSNTVVGPNQLSTWQITAANTSVLNTKTTLTGFRNVTGGSANDTFTFSAGGSLAGNLNGGGGTNTLAYATPAIWVGQPFNYAAGIVPLVAGTATNLQVLPMQAISPGNQSSPPGATVSGVAVTVAGGSGSFNFAATGLPTGLSIHPQTGIISGTVAAGASVNNNVQVTVTAGSIQSVINFTWSVVSFSLVNPGNQSTAIGDIVNLPIQVANPFGTITFSATGLPNGLSINPSTGVITGTALAGPPTQSVQINATNGAKVDSVMFEWYVRSFSIVNPGNMALPEGVQLSIPLQINNPNNLDLTYSVSAVPNGYLYVDNEGMLRGTFYITGTHSTYNVTVTVSDQNQFTSTTFAIQVLQGFTFYPPGDRAFYSGSQVSESISLNSTYGHNLSLEVTGLPPGVSIDAERQITGTIGAVAANTEFEVTLLVTNHTLGYTYEDKFTWTVLKLPTLDEVNAGTPAGTPWVGTILDPANNPFPRELTAVTYTNSPGSPTVVYFTWNNVLWKFGSNGAEPVPSIDSEYPELVVRSILGELPGGGLLVCSNDGNLWRVTLDGAQMVYDVEIDVNYEAQTFQWSGGAGYFVSYQYDESVGYYVSHLYRVTVDGSNQLAFEVLTTASASIEYKLHSYKLFAGGVVFSGAETSEPYQSTLYWLDPTTKILRTLSTSPYQNAFTDLVVAPGNSGTHNLFFVVGSLETGHQLKVINSAHMAMATPTVTPLTDFGNSRYLGTGVYPGQVITAVGNRLAFVTQDRVTGEQQFWLSNGTGPGTLAVGAPFVGHPSYGSIGQAIVHDGSIYFSRTPYFTEITPTTVVAQVWKLDPATQQFTVVQEFVGQDAANNTFIEFQSVAGKLYYTGWNTAAQRAVMWSLETGGTPTPILPKPENLYRDAAISYSMVFANVGSPGTELEFAL